MKVIHLALLVFAMGGIGVTSNPRASVGRARAVTIATGPSGALDCVDFGDGVCDVVTAVVPLKANANTITGAWTFQQLRVALYTVNTLPKCNGGLEGQMLGVTDASAATYNGLVQGGGQLHLQVYCNGSDWVMH